MGKLGQIVSGGLTGGLFGAANAAGIGIGDIARHGGFGLLGMALAKKKKGQFDPSDNPGQTPPIAPTAGERLKRGGSISAADAVHKHERNMHKGKKPTKFAKGGSTASKRGDGIAKKGKTKGRFV